MPENQEVISRDNVIVSEHVLKCFYFLCKIRIEIRIEIRSEIRSKIRSKIRRDFRRLGLKDSKGNLHCKNFF